MNPEIEKFVSKITDTDEKAVLKLLNPTPDRVEMGEVYLDTLGYDPITYFDEYETRQKLAEIVNKLPVKFRSEIQNHYDDIINDAITVLYEKRSGTIEDILKASVRNIFDDEEVDMIFDNDGDDDDFDSKYVNFEDDDDDLDYDKIADDLNVDDTWEDGIRFDDED